MLTINNALELYKYKSLADVSKNKIVKDRDELLKEYEYDNASCDSEYQKYCNQKIKCINEGYELLVKMLIPQNPNIRPEGLLPEHYFILKYGYVNYYKRYNSCRGDKNV